MWRTHYGPVLDFPGFGWSDSTHHHSRCEHRQRRVHRAVPGAGAGPALDDLIELDEAYNGVPLFNTVAVSVRWSGLVRGPLCHPGAVCRGDRAYESALESDLLRLAGDNGAVLLDGSDPLFEWLVPGARDPGLVPYSEQPRWSVGLRVQRERLLLDAARH